MPRRLEVVSRDLRRVKLGVKEIVEKSAGIDTVVEAIGKALTRQRAA